jgi:hypothetical protein
MRADRAYQENRLKAGRVPRLKQAWKEAAYGATSRGGALRITP